MKTEEYEKIVKELEDDVVEVLVGGQVLKFNKLLERLKDKGFQEYSENVLRDALNNLFKKGWIEIRLPAFLGDKDDEQFSICIGEEYYHSSK